MERIHPVILDILKKRGITAAADIAEFLSDKPQLTYDPFLLLHLEAGVDFILSAIDKGEKICIYGDYDADGITSICLLMQILSKLTDRLFYYIPSRFDEGYGLNCDAIDKIHAQGAQCIVTVDCGSVSYREVEHAKALGLRILVTDHHNINDRPADCLMINPKQQACSYPFSDLCGCGVAFKLAQGIQRKAKLPKAVLTEVLDLVAIATVGDIVPLIGENRSLVKYGLSGINKGRRKGLKALILAAGLSLGKIKSESLAYVIVPHLNAAGRMMDAKIGVELLLAQDDKRIKDCVDILIANNKERRLIQEETLKLCASLVEQNMKEDRFLVVYSENIHEGIAGIVAGKLKDRFRRPAIVVTDTDQKGEKAALLKGTGRSMDGIDLYRLLKSHEELFLRFGGHAGACGFTMKAENLPLLKDLLEREMESLLETNPELFLAPLKVDGKLLPCDVNLDFLNQLEILAPFGYRNERPLFAFEDVLLSNIIYMGKERQHMRFQCRKQEQEAVVSCVLFNGATKYGDSLQGGPKALFGCPEANLWNGRTQVQILVGEIIEMSEEIES